MRYRTKPVRGGVRVASALVAAITLMLAGVAPASASTWTLQDIDQRICLRPDSPFPNTYVLAPVVGTWTSTITTGIRNFPPGSTNNGSSTFPPGSHDGSYINGFIGVSIAAAPEGDHIGEVWASDGTVTQAVPVLLRYDYRTNCWV
ncbi:MAG: DUF5980 family protein [Actinophytocola sp.]|uniref:DUF5980 family protein n=1 Tax=Actinophytocola sp. TaxID=1872138 RepID=UPI003C775190